MTAALLIGVVSALTIPGGVIGSGGKLLLMTGIIGGLSTFSSFIWATNQMLANPVEQASAMVYLVLSMVAGFLPAESGLARWPSAPDLVRGNRLKGKAGGLTTLFRSMTTRWPVSEVR
jgi:fluoride ion exporter CrcB/FEX